MQEQTRRCPRCHTALPDDDPNTLIFCWNCGAPQVMLSEELQDQAAAQMRGPSAAGDADASGLPRDPSPESTAVLWRRMIRIAAVVTLALAAFDILLPPLALLAPAIVLAFYAARSRKTTITTGVGARVGALCGVFSACCISSLIAAAILVSRFSTHRTTPAGASVLARVQAQVTAQQGPAAAEFLKQFAVPEIRVGFFLSILAVASLGLLVLSIAGGAFAGFVRSHMTARSRG